MLKRQLKWLFNNQKTLWMRQKEKKDEEKNLIEKIKKPILIITLKSKKNDFKRITTND